MNILLLENDPDSTKLIENILKKNNHRVISTVSINEAISVLKTNNRIKIIICEMLFDKSNGFEFLKFIHTNYKHRKLQTLIISSIYDKETIVKCIELGASDYLVKPFTEDTLLKKVKKIEKQLTKKVLIVDDDELIRNLLKKTLERENFNTILCASADEALSCIKEQENNIGVVISDIEMPQMNGFELLKELKKEIPDLPVLMITGKTSNYHQSDFLDAGADGYIVKPFKNTEIIEKVSSALF